MGDSIEILVHQKNEWRERAEAAEARLAALTREPLPTGTAGVVTEALMIAADLLTHAATSEDGIDAADAAEGVRLCRAALAASTRTGEGASA